MCLKCMNTEIASKLGNKVLIIGCAGSGKTTLCKKLSKILNLPIIHLDNYYWEAGWNKVQTDKWISILESLVKKSEWIMDGNYTQSLPLRLKESTSVIYLDTPRYKCLWRAFKRRLTFWKNREDIPYGCTDRFSLSFYLWIWHYPKRSRQRTLDLLAGFSGQVIILENDQEVNNFINNIKR